MTFIDRRSARELLFGRRAEDDSTREGKQLIVGRISLSSFEARSRSAKVRRLIDDATSMWQEPQSDQASAPSTSRTR